MRIKLSKFYEENHHIHLWLHTLFIDHTYQFRSPSVTILSVYSIKEYNKKYTVQY
jgi:hypothetical protein